MLALGFKKGYNYLVLKNVGGRTLFAKPQYNQKL